MDRLRKGMPKPDHEAAEKKKEDDKNEEEHKAE